MGRKKEASYVCSHPLTGHPQCESCGILASEGHLVQELVRYREKMLCPGCVKRWEGLEKVLEHPLTFGEMVMDDGARARVMAKNPPHRRVRTKNPPRSVC